MALIALDGFDKYGPANSVSANVAALLTAGEWTSTAGTLSIVAPLSATGYALNVAAPNGNVSKTLAASYGRLIGGFRFAATLSGSGANGAIEFRDAGTTQCAVTINFTGLIIAKNGTALSGTVLGTSTASVSSSTTHYLEFDITFGNAGSYQVWLDGVSILSGSGDTTTTANNTANAILLSQPSGSNTTFDDFYLLDATGPAPLNAPLLTSPRIETQIPASDGAVQFAVGAAIVGATMSRGGPSGNFTANQLRLRAVVPVANCTLSSISMLAGPTGNGTISIRPVVYANSGSAPGALMSAGATVVGTVANTSKTMPLTTPQSLVAGTTYWIGHMVDTAVTSGLAGYVTGVNDDLIATSTFASGAPGTAPAMSTAAGTVIWGNVSITGANWPAVAQNPSQGSLSYVYDATVGHEDLYNFPPLSVVPSAIYATAIKASVSKSDAGAKTVSLRQKSGSTDSSGGAQAPGTSFAWLTSLYPTDPNGGGAWTLAALNAAQGGVRVES